MPPRNGACDPAPFTAPAHAAQGAAVHTAEGSTVSQHRGRGRKQRSASFVEPSPGEHTRDGSTTKTTQGYGTAQGASGATPGGADPGGSVGSPGASPEADAGRETPRRRPDA